MRRPPRTASAVLRFAAGSLAAIAVVVVGSFFVLRSITIQETDRTQAALWAERHGLGPTDR